MAGTMQSPVAGEGLSISALPPEILIPIIRRLDHKSRLNITLVCKRLANIARDLACGGVCVTLPYPIDHEFEDGVCSPLVEQVSDRYGVLRTWAGAIQTVRFNLNALLPRGNDTANPFQLALLALVLSFLPHVHTVRFWSYGHHPDEHFLERLVMAVLRQAGNTAQNIVLEHEIGSNYIFNPTDVVSGRIVEAVLVGGGHVTGLELTGYDLPLADTFPDRTCENITRLHLDVWPNSDQLTQACIRLTHLQCLEIRNESVFQDDGEDPSFTFLENCPSLARLDVKLPSREHGNALNGNLSAAPLAYCQRLTHVNIISVYMEEFVDLDIPTIVDIPPLPHLVHFKCGQGIFVNNLSFIAGSPSLKSVCVHAADEIPVPDSAPAKLLEFRIIGDETPEDRDVLLRTLSFLGACTELKTLLLLSVNTLDASVIATLTTLTDIEISHMVLPPILPIANFKHLVALSLRHCGDLESLGPATNGSFPHLREVDLAYNLILRDISVLRHATNVRTIFLHHLPHISDVSFLGSCTRLTALRLYSLDAVRDLEALRGHPSLRSVTIGMPHCPKDPLLDCPQLDVESREMIYPMKSRSVEEN